jgi:PadR family transcriptional regulator, regulatory protein PadR
MPITVAGLVCSVTSVAIAWNDGSIAELTPPVTSPDEMDACDSCHEVRRTPRWYTSGHTTTATDGSRRAPAVTKGWKEPLVNARLGREQASLRRVLRVLLEDPMAEHYGLEIGKAAGLVGGSLYPLLLRLEQAGILVSDWEEADPSEARRPRRRLYRLTSQGTEYARQALLDAQRSLTLGESRTLGFPVPGGASA